MISRIIPLITVPNCPIVKDPIFMLATFEPSFTPPHTDIKLPIAVVKDIIKGEKPKSPAPKPFVRAFAERAIPKRMASPTLISPDLSKSAISGFSKMLFIDFGLVQSFEGIEFAPFRGRAIRIILRPIMKSKKAPTITGRVPGRILFSHLPKSIPERLKRKAITAIIVFEKMFICIFLMPYEIPTPKLSILADTANPRMINHSIYFHPFSLTLYL